ncbi:MAG: DUF1326 domain-containing protein [Rubrivivax sp.]
MPMLLLPLLAAAEAGPTHAVRGDYVEARTASVFAGACHYNGERVTEGKSALLAWRLDGGSFDGIDLGGVKLAAVVACDDNLAERAATRRSAITVDADSDVKANAAVAWVKQRVGDQLGEVVSVRRAPVTFEHPTDAFVVRVDGFGSMSVKAMPDRACCSQPELVWYQPLMPVTDRRVGYTASAQVAVVAIGADWQRSDENSAIYGRFER